MKDEFVNKMSLLEQLVDRLLSHCRLTVTTSMNKILSVSKRAEPEAADLGLHMHAVAVDAVHECDYPQHID